MLPKKTGVKQRTVSVGIATDTRLRDGWGTRGALATVLAGTEGLVPVKMLPQGLPNEAATAATRAFVLSSSVPGPLTGKLNLPQAAVQLSLRSGQWGISERSVR